MGLIGYAAGFGFPVVAGFCLNIFCGFDLDGFVVSCGLYNIVCGGFVHDWWVWCGWDYCSGLVDVLLVGFLCLPGFGLLWCAVIGLLLEFWVWFRLFMFGALGLAVQWFWI